MAVCNTSNMLRGSGSSCASDLIRCSTCGLVGCKNTNCANCILNGLRCRGCNTYGVGSGQYKKLSAREVGNSISRLAGLVLRYVVDVLTDHRTEMRDDPAPPVSSDTPRPASKLTLSHSSGLFLKIFAATVVLSLVPYLVEKMQTGSNSADAAGTKTVTGVSSASSPKETRTVPTVPETPPGPSVESVSITIEPDERLDPTGDLTDSRETEISGPVTFSMSPAGSYFGVRVPEKNGIQEVIPIVYSFEKYRADESKIEALNRLSDAETNVTVKGRLLEWKGGRHSFSSEVPIRITYINPGNIIPEVQGKTDAPGLSR